MGWWSSDILGGDTPLDAVGMLEQNLDWNVKEDGDITSAKPTVTARFLKKLAVPSYKKSLKAYLQSMTAKDGGWGAPSILAVVEVMLRHGAKIDKQVAGWARQAIKDDEWGQEGDESRLAALEDFRVRLDAAVAGQAPKKTTFKVHLKRTIEMDGTFEVEAVSPKQAQEQAEELAKAAEIVEATTYYWPSGKPKNVWIKEPINDRTRTREVVASK